MVSPSTQPAPPPPQATARSLPTPAAWASDRPLRTGLALLALASLSLGCAALDEGTVRGSGDIVTEDYPLAGFDGLEVRRGWDVVVVPGDGFEVSISADDNVVEHLEIELDGTELRLDIDDGMNLNRATVVARITLPALRRVALHSGASGRLDGPIVPDDLALRVDGGSELDCSGVSAGTLSVDLAGGSEADCRDVTAHTLMAASNGGSGLRLEGEIASATIEGSGASELHLAGLVLTGADVRLTGGSEADLQVSGVLEVELKDGSHVHLAGDPTIARSELEDGSTVTAVTPG